MQSKVILFVLFMLSFTLLHDTVIYIIHTDKHTSMVETKIQKSEYTDCANIEEVHSMFHFVGLVITHKSRFIALPTKQTLLYRSLQYSPPYKKLSYKPPRV